MRYLIWIGIVAALFVTTAAYLGMRDARSVQKGIDAQVAADIAKANQNIAERRKTDAQFDKLDAAAVCREFDRQWVFVNGKSECH